MIELVPTATNYLVPIFLLVLLTTASGIIPSQARAPVTLICAVWIGVFVLHYAVTATNVIDVYPSSLRANSLVAFAIIAFSAGVFATSAVAQHLKLGSSKPRSTGRGNTRLMDWLLLTYSSIVTVWTISVFGSISAISGNDYSFTAVRRAVNYGGAEWGIVSHFGLSVTVAAVFLSVRMPRDMAGRVPIFGVVVCAAIISILSTARTTFFCLVIGLIFASTWGTIPRPRRMFIAGTVLLVSFLATGLALNKIGGASLGLLSVAKAGLNSIGFYMLSPLSAFSASEPWEMRSVGAPETLRFFVAVASALGLTSTPVPPLVQPFIFVPNPTNVYTFAQLAYRDFGWYAACYFAFLGGVYGLLFSLPRHITSVRVLVGFSFYPLVLSFFHDQFLTLASQWIQIAAAAILLAAIYAWFQDQGRGKN